MFNSRAKGRRAEREVGKLLQQWWQQVEPGCQFCSTPSSGGWATPELRGHFKVSGDLTTTAQRFPWTVEVKFREGWSLENLERAKPSPVWGWWEQALEQAHEQRAWPMLWLRHSREPWRIMVAVDDPLQACKLLSEVSWLRLQYGPHRVQLGLADEVLRVLPSGW